MDLTEEQQLFNQGYRLVGGIDEAGRGPLAGPVVAACVVIAPDFLMKKEYLLIKDSKKLSEKNRDEISSVILKEFAGVGIGCCDHQVIDRINILQASFLAMKKAIGSLRIKPDHIMLDGKFPIPNFSLPQRAVIKGDALIFSIAAASIVAKAHRDMLMREMDEKFPGYGFAIHKGYGTKLHMDKLKELGPCEIHRKSFKPIKKYLDNN
jgi:ribonuclease HII